MKAQLICIFTVMVIGNISGKETEEAVRDQKRSIENAINTGSSPLGLSTSNIILPPFARGNVIPWSSSGPDTVSTINRAVPVPVAQPYELPVTRTVPVSIPHPVEVPVPRAVPVSVPQPYRVNVDRPVPVEVYRAVPKPISVAQQYIISPLSQVVQVPPVQNSAISRNVPLVRAQPAPLQLQPQPLQSLPQPIFLSSPQALPLTASASQPLSAPNSLLAGSQLAFLPTQQFSLTISPQVLPQLAYAASPQVQPQLAYAASPQVVPAGVGYASGYSRGYAAPVVHRGNVVAGNW